MIIQRIAKRVRIARALGADPLSATRIAFARPSSQASPRLAKGRMRGQTFLARGQDFPALTEVVLDDEYAFVRSLLRDSPSPTVLDLGANIGLFAIVVLESTATATVHSFEPVPSTFAVLLANKERLGLPSWHCYNLAIADSDSFVPLAARPWSTSARVEPTRDWEGVTLSPAIKLSTLLRKLDLQYVDLMKVDIEGVEEDVLFESHAQFAGIRNLVVEVHPPTSDTGRIVELLVKEFAHVYEVQRAGSTKPLLVGSRSDLSHVATLGEVRFDEKD